MKTNIDRSLRLVTKDQNEKTYDWAIIEVDDEGQQSSPELKPWRWTLGFTATEISVISETVVNEERGRSDDYARQREEIHHGQRINAKLVPESSDDFFHPREATTYRMFGTDRVIKNFDLEIIPLENEDEKESCYAVGYPSYTAEIDFVNEYFSDYVSFVIKVKPSTFSQYINPHSPSKSLISLS
ncbi:hypothetical protein [Paracoccus fontiphilus]|uniref:Uncharacterized protein n=1 Tax=Paracoccus fontiphilus TaxID=1815556 RepID=A0ABV7I8I2_9RHOB|nr:hypothetical protein [Paracoccus fontiphilus]